MSPDLGDYAGTVLLSYAASLALLAFITGWSFLRWRRVKAQLAALEAQRGR